MIFQNRKHAGELLANKLLKYKSTTKDTTKSTTQNVVVLALPCGGVPLAVEIAKSLQAPLDVLIVRKIGAPFNAELAVGAICENEEPIFNMQALSKAGLEPDDMKPIADSEKKEVQRQINVFRQGRGLIDTAGKTAIIVDDGLATGATLKAAIKYLKKKGVSHLVVAVPVAPSGSARVIREKVDEFIILEERQDLFSVGQWYKDFSQISDKEVLVFLNSQPGIKSSQEAKSSGRDLAAENLKKSIAKAMIKIGKEDDFDLLIASVKEARVVMLGEATHGTLEYYRVRAQISQRLIKDHGFKFIAVEGDWPDAYRLHQYIQTGKGGNARSVLMHNHRWPTWMWANEEIVKLAEWMRNTGAGFYGLDVYSLFESIDMVTKYLKKNYPKLAEEIERRYACLASFEGDEIAYAKSLVKYPAGCENEVLLNLQELLKIRLEDMTANSRQNSDELFAAKQNAHIIANAEAYYRSMLRADASAWNIRDGHMMETLDRLLENSGEGGKAIVWAHNTHIGDYRATDMKSEGYINLGGLARLSYGNENVALVGFGSYQGKVLAASTWDGPEKIMDLSPAQEESYENYFHKVAVENKTNQFYILLNKGNQDLLVQLSGKQLKHRLKHRAIGVVYNPIQEFRGNYVPTDLTKQYDSFIFIDKTHALKSLYTVYAHGEFPETWPTGL